ncbi:hypothetical protein XPA_005932 [Xanthoria parietina]
MALTEVTVTRADSRKKTASSQQQTTNNLQKTTMNDDDGDSDNTERPTTENQTVLINDGYLLPPRVIPAIGYLHLAIAATQGRANQFLDDWIMLHPAWQVLDNSPDLHGNTQCTLVRGRAHGGSIMMQMKVAEINIIW